MIRNITLQIQGWAYLLARPTLLETVRWNLEEVGLPGTLAALHQDANDYAYLYAKGRL